VSDWNNDGLHDSYDEAHEFGIDLDGGSDVHDLAADDGFGGLFDLEWIDLADILGASLTDGLGLDLPAGADPAAGIAAVATAVALPAGDAFYAALDHQASLDEVRGWVRGLSLANPFPAAPGTAPGTAPDGPGAAAPEGTAPDTAV
jgi:hypothetical protein